MNTPEELQWQDEGLCRNVDPEIFFPDAGAPNKQAKMICQGCPVKDQCLEYALELVGFDVVGIWGGKSKRERRIIRAKRNKITELKASA